MTTNDPTTGANSFEDFVRMATVRGFSAPAPQIQVVGETATAACPWTMTCTSNGFVTTGRFVA